MSPETDLRQSLDRSLDQLPSIPAAEYLLEGRRVRRRRRVLTGLVAAPALSLVVGLVVGQLAARDHDATTSVTKEMDRRAAVGPADPERDPDYAAPHIPLKAVEGLQGVDHFTTDDTPTWAKDFALHMPVVLNPDGRLWLAPGTVVRRTVINPYQPGDGGKAPITSSYAVEAKFPRAPRNMP